MRDEVGYWVWVILLDLGLGFEIKILRANGIEKDGRRDDGAY